MNLKKPKFWDLVTSRPGYVPKRHQQKIERNLKVWLRTLEKMGRPQKNWISVGDRANDIYDFLSVANRLGWKYVVRARHDRNVEIDGEKRRLFSSIRKQTAQCVSTLYMKAKGEEFGSDEVTLEITWVEIKLFPSRKCGFFSKRRSDVYSGRVS